MTEENTSLPCISPASFWAPQHILESAWLEHAPFAFWLMEKVQPTVLVELGTHAGFSFFAFCQAVQRLGLPTRCYAIDTWIGDEHAGFYGEQVFNTLSDLQRQHYLGFSQLIRAYFHDALSNFTDGGIDLLHIDGRHRYEDVVEDYTTWLPKMSEHGIVLFHDINVRKGDFGVWRLWEELRGKHPSFEFSHGHGLGVICPNSSVPPGLRPLLESSTEAAVATREAYARLGAAVSTQYQLERAHSELGSEIRALHHKLEARAQNEEQLRADLLLSQDELSITRHDLSSVQNVLVSTNNEIAQIRASTIWRATKIARDVGSRLPLPMRHQLRRGAKAVWWAITPHRMPERLRLLRARGILQQAVLSGTTGARSNQHLVYQPSHASFGTSLANNKPQGTYRLASHSSGYVFVPRRRPDNLDAQITQLTNRPTFSIIVPLYNTPDDLFQRMVGSVLAQWYQHWELILIDDKSQHQSVRDNASQLVDPRIKTIFLASNLGISGATNRGLAEATGDYIVFLDHDDELTDDCLFELAKCIDAEDPDYVYSDEDKIEPDGRFSQPFFKPDWSPDTLMSTMYTCHVSCVRRSLLERVGTLRSEFDGSQDWDFILRVTEMARRISHVPKILYHWRIIPQSVASDLNAKPYAVDAGRRARVAALDRRGLKGTIEAVPQLAGYFRIKYDVQGDPLVSIIIPSKNNGTILKKCLDSIFENSHYRNFEIVLVDNGSTDTATINYLTFLHAISNVRVIRHDAPFNYSEINNIGAREAKGSLLLFLNDDTEMISSDSIQRMAGYAQLAHVGAVGAKLLYPDSRKIQHSGVLNLADGPNHAFLLTDTYNPGYFARNIIEYDWIAVTGACLMIERTKFDAIGGFDETFPVAYNDVDLCFRLVENGLYNVVCPSVEFFHYESLSRGNDNKDKTKRQRLDHEKDRLYHKHPHFLMHDPFHNPNLAPNDLWFSLA
ncbi:glycosyltransferase [Acetobacter orientalis]|uniref:glycosyltransferase family 2 protein n=1 Tax=Acetobacter orientalis TaxID=146474 RepID=UPI00248DCBDB|nr:glycosyltransferase [Acetobacter orientalis]